LILQPQCIKCSTQLRVRGTSKIYNTVVSDHDPRSIAWVFAAIASSLPEGGNRVAEVIDSAEFIAGATLSRSELEHGVPLICSQRRACERTSGVFVSETATSTSLGAFVGRGQLPILFRTQNLGGAERRPESLRERDRPQARAAA